MKKILLQRYLKKMAAMATNQPWNANSEKECHGERWSRPEGYPTGIFVRNSLCTIGQDATKIL